MIFHALANDWKQELTVLSTWEIASNQTKRPIQEKSSFLSKSQTEPSEIENTHLLDCITVAMEMRSDICQTGGNWSGSLSLRCQRQRQAVNGVLLLPRGADRGSQRAAQQTDAYRISHERMRGRETKAFPDALGFYGNGKSGSPYWTLSVLVFAIMWKVSEFLWDGG